jgi:hypothetical protein
LQTFVGIHSTVDPTLKAEVALFIDGLRNAGLPEE